MFINVIRELLGQNSGHMKFGDRSDITTPRQGGVENRLTMVNRRLGHQGHGHLSITDVEVEGPSPMPTQGLVEFEKLFEMPALWIMNREILDFVTVGSGQEGFEI